MKTQTFPLLFLASVTGACGDKSSSSDASPVEVIVNEDEFKDRIIHTDEEEINVESVDAQLKTGSVDFTLARIATVAAPTVNGLTLQATRVVYDSKSLMTYVSFNLAGETQLGAVSQIAASDVSKPSLKAEIRFANADVNNLALAKDAIWAVGAENGSAYLKQIPLLGSGQVFSKDVTTYGLTGYAGTGVTLLGDNVYATSGSNGGLTIFKKTDMKQVDYFPYSDARDISAASNDVFVVKGTNGAIMQVSGNAKKVAEIEVGGATIAESKSTVEVGKTSIVTAVGDGGVSVICQADGKSMVQVKALSVAGIAAGNSVTNAATITNGLLFTANGEAGVAVYSMKEVDGVSTTKCKGVAVTLLGRLELGTGFSANAVHFYNGILYVANGSGGVELIKVTRESASDDFKDAT